MRRVQFNLVKNGNSITYPDDISLFSNTSIKGDQVFADYSGSDNSIQDAGPERLELTINVDKNQAATGEAIAYTGSFNNASLNIPSIPLSIMDRNGQHVKNVGVAVVNGNVSGSFSFDKSGDYYINETGINYHKNLFREDIKLVNGEILIRVTE